MQATLYVEKARLFAKSKFVVGYDTAIRLVMPKYYGGHVKMLLELTALHHRGCQFLVAGRTGDNGKFLTLKDVEIPNEIADQVHRFPDTLMICLATITQGSGFSAFRLISSVASLLMECLNGSSFQHANKV